MSKVIYQVIPAELYNDYKQTVLSGFQFGWNFYLDNYKYCYALVVRKVIRKRLRYAKRSFPPWRTASPHVRKKRNLGPLVIQAPWVIFNQLLLRWGWRISTYLWYKEPQETDKKPDQACQYGKKYWYSLFPGGQNGHASFARQIFPYYTFRTMLFLSVLRRPPWATKPHIYLTNQNTNAIYLWDIEEETILQSFYSVPGDLFPFSGPMGICEHKGYLYIVDNGNKRIQVRWSDSLVHVTNIVCYGPYLTLFENITDIAADSSYIYVLEETKNTLIRINKNNVAKATEISLYNSDYGNITKPSYICLTYDKIYISSETDNRIIILDKSTLRRIPWTPGGDSRGQCWTTPAGIDHDGVFLNIAEKESGNLAKSLLGESGRIATRSSGGKCYDVVTIGYYYITICADTGRLRIFDKDNYDWIKTITAGNLVGCGYMTARQQQYFQADVQKKITEWAG